VDPIEWGGGRVRLKKKVKEEVNDEQQRNDSKKVFYFI
jgi:hypothetical protein